MPRKRHSLTQGSRLRSTGWRAAQGARTLSIEMHPETQVVVRSPWSALLSRVKDALSRQSKWGLKQIEHFLCLPPS
ncbi:MAG: hypothetical protein ACYYK0_02085 [Candidatus Eutrophobiaceae bacterium]